MILKRDEKDGIVNALYNSSNILASTYDLKKNELVIIFKSGTKYKYKNVSKSDYMRFEIAESQGSVFNKYIKNYEFEKMESIDVVKLITEISKASEEEKKGLLESKKNRVYKIIKDVITYEKVEDFDFNTFEAVLIKLKSEIDDFISEKQNK